MSDTSGTEKEGGLGAEGTIPPHLTGVAATLGDEGSNFNPEEDPEAASTADAPGGAPADAAASDDAASADSSS